MHHWAKSDDPDGYNNLSANKIEKLILIAASSCSSQDVALIIKEKYQGRIVTTRRIIKKKENFGISMNIIVIDGLRLMDKLRSKQ